MTAPRLAIVIPCFNEQAMLPHTIEVVMGHLDSLVARGLVAGDSYVMLVDDGSSDDTWQLIKSMHAANPRVKGISLAHNRGQQAALIAGMEAVTDRCDICITMDADLQDDPEAMASMIEAYNKGAEVVLGQRSSREKDSWTKRVPAMTFYKFQRAMGVKILSNHAEYRLMSNSALHMLGAYGERAIYLRGIISQLSDRTAVVTYPRGVRTAGESKYNFARLLALAADGITSFTARPMTLIFIIGLILMLIDIIIAVWALVSYIAGVAVSGWTSLILSVWFLGSLILMAIGIVGEYIGKIYVEVKQRPRYALREELFD